MEPQGQDFLDVMEQVQSKSGTAVSEKPGRNGKRFAKIKFSVQEALDSVTNPIMKAQLNRLITMSVNSYDLGGIRLTSVADVEPELANKQTIFMDIAEQNPVLPATDFQIQWPEYYMGDDVVEFFNLNGANPSEAEMDRGIDTNTMGAFGNKLNIRWITSELAAQSPKRPFAEKAKQLAMQLGRMKRFANSKLLANSEVTSETPGFFPQWGGFVTRSTDNALVLGVAGNLTNAIIQGRVDAIYNLDDNNGMGVIPLVCLCSAAQIAVVRDLMIARYPGETSIADAATQAVLKATLPGVNVPPDMVRLYKPDPGRAVLFVQEPQLASGQALFFDPMQPHIARMSLRGAFGPWAIERPTEELTELMVVFDFISLVDPLRPSRALVSNLL